MSIQVCIRAYLSSGSSSDRWYKLNTEPQREDFLAVAFKRDWEVVDHEGFGQNLDLPGSQEGIVALSRCVERYGEAFALYASAVGQAYLTIAEDGECEDFDEAYRGFYPDKNGFAEELIEDESFPSKKELANYVDTERLARDCDLDGSFDEEGEMTKGQMEAKVEEWLDDGSFSEKIMRQYIDVDYATRELEHDYYIIQGDQGWHIFDRSSGGGMRKNPSKKLEIYDPSKKKRHDKSRSSDPYFTGNYINFQVPQDIVDSIPRGGSADAAISDAFNDRRVAKIFAGLDHKKIIQELAQYGAWERSELIAMGPQELEEKMLWIACGQIQEEAYQ